MRNNRTLYMGLIFGLFIIACKKEKNDVTAPPTSPIRVIKAPKLSTDTISDLTAFSVTLGGQLLDTVGSQVKELGIVVGLTAQPTVINKFNQFKLPADNSGKFRQLILALPASTTFYIRAYGINATDTGYGNEVMFTTMAEKVLQGNGPVYLTTQKEVNDFGAQNYTKIVNGLNIVGTDITDLSPLHSINNLGGGLNIQSTSIKNFKGLDNLEVIGSFFFNTSSIEYNPFLENCDGLQKLKRISGPLQFVGNQSMVNLQGLNNLLHIWGGSLGIYQCNSFQSFGGLDKLYKIDFDIYLTGNPLLQNFKGLNSITELPESIRIKNCVSFRNFEGLERVKKLTSIYVEQNPELTSFYGLQNLTSISSIGAISNNQLGDFSAFSKLSIIDGIYIQGANSLTNLSAFANIITVKDQISILQNDNLVSLTGLEQLEKLTTLTISGNKKLIDISALSKLKELTGSSYSLTISSNEMLRTLKGLEALRLASGQIYIGENKTLTDFCALKPFLLQYSGNSFVVMNNAVNPTKSNIISSCP